MKLIELVLVIVILGVLMVAFFLPVISGIDLWEQIRFRQDLFSEAQYGLERMVREISCALDDRSITSASPDTFTFTSSATSEWVTFTYDATTRTLKRQSDNLMGGYMTTPVQVSAFALTYYDMWNNAPSTPQVMPGYPYTNIWRIRISLTVVSQDGGQSLTLEEDVFPKAFQRENKGGQFLTWE